MLNEKVTQLLNDQINKEFYSAYLYLDFSIFCEDEGLDGFANWFEIQAKEEMDHGTLILKYLQNNSICPSLGAIAKPDVKIESVEDTLNAALNHEKYVTSLIHTIYETAFDVKDFRTMQFLDWFVKEQGEEEKNTEDLVKKYGLFGHDAKGLYELNSELASRTYSAPDLDLS